MTWPGRPFPTMILKRFFNFEWVFLQQAEYCTSYQCHLYSTSLLTFTPDLPPPDGWTTDPEDLDYEFWATDDSEGQQRARQADIQRAVPNMIATRESGNYEVMFRAGGKFYSWDMIDGGLWEVNASQDLNTAIETMVTKGDRGLKLKEIRKWWICIYSGGYQIPALAFLSSFWQPCYHTAQSPQLWI